MDVALLLLRDRGAKRRFPLSREIVTIGRREDCDLRIPLGDVSRKHCSIVKSEQQLEVQDLGSSNGTYVNGERIQKKSLRAGDRLRIGSLHFVVQVDGKPDESEADEFTIPGTAIGSEASDSDPGYLAPTQEVDAAELGFNPGEQVDIDDLMKD